MAPQNIIGDNIKNPNLALFKAARQSSVFQNLGPAKVVDGNNGVTFSLCSKTSVLEDWLWWMVDLNAVHTIKSTAISVFNEGLHNFTVEVSMEDPVKLKGFPGPTNAFVCLANPGIVTVKFPPNIFACERPEIGRYFRILKFNDRLQSKSMRLCEVEIYSHVEANYTLPQNSKYNLAFKKKTHQSSTKNYYTSDKAVDGHLSGLLRDSSCTHTDIGPRPHWWFVDLGGSYSIDSVRIVNRLDCCQSRLRNFTIQVATKYPTSSPEFPTKIDALMCHKQVDTLIHRRPALLKCDTPVTGRYVMVVKGGDVLTLCEVEVFGKPTPIEKGTNEIESERQWHLHCVAENVELNQPPNIDVPNLAATCAEEYGRERIDVEKYPFIQVNKKTGECKFLQTAAETQMPGNMFLSWILYKYYD